MGETVTVYGVAQERLDLDTEEAASRWRRGRIAFAGEEVAVRSPDGDLGFVPNDPERLRTALDSGYTLASPEAAKDERTRTQADDPLAAFAEGAASLPVIGSVPTFVAEQLGQSRRFGEEARLSAKAYGERARAREEVNPIASGAGRVVSDIAQLAATGVTGLAARGALAATGAAAGRLGTGLAGRAAMTALRFGTEGAIEGAALGARDALSEAAIGDVPLSAERIATRIGMDALLGFGAGGAIGGAGRLFGDVAGRAGRRALSRATDLAGGAAASAPASLRRVIGPDALEEFAQRGAWRALRPIKKFSNMALDRAGGAEGVGEVLLRRGIVRPRATVETMADDIARALEESGDAIGTIVRRVDEMGTAVSPSAIRREAEALTAGLEASAFRSNRVLAKKFGDEVGEFLKRLDEGDIGLDELWRQRRELDGLAYSGGMHPNPVAAQLQALRHVVETTIDDTVTRAGADIGEALSTSYRAAKKDYSALVLARDTSQDTLRSLASNRGMSLTDYMGGSVGALLGGATGGAPGAMALGFLTGKVHKWWRENNRQILASGAHRASQILRARQEAAKVAVKSDSAVRRYLERLRTRADSLPKAKPRDAVRVARLLSVTEFKDRVDAVRSFSSDPAGSIDRLGRHTSALASAAPQTTAGVHQAAARAASFLRERIPPTALPRTGLLTAMSPPRLVSDTERMRFMRYSEAVEDPQSVFDDLADGSLTREGVEVLREVYPSMYADLTRAVMEQITELDEPPDYMERIQLGLLLGLTTDPSLEPGFVMAMQASYAQAPAQPQPTQPTPDLASQSLSETQRLDARRSARR